MKAGLPCWVGGLILAGGLLGADAAPPPPPAVQAQQAAAADPRALEAWPDDKELEHKRHEAETRRLFQTQDVLEFSIVADFRAVQRDRNVTSEQTFPATVVYPHDGATASSPILIRTRGNSRRKPQVCDFAPLRLEFDKPQMKGTVFAGHNSLKLGTHCRNSGDYEQYVLREHSAYRLYNLLTPRSFRTRLARATYVDERTKRTVAERYALLIEDDDDVAERMLGRIMSMRGIPFRAVDMDTLTLMMVFQYMIGNTDHSLANQHNVRLVQTREGRRYAVPYDFDYSGLVDAVYAIPDKQFGIGSVRDRLYRGPCRTPEELEPVFAQFRAVKADVMALYDELPGMSNPARRNAKDYLEEFFRQIDRPRDVKRAFIDNCNGRIGSE